MEQNYIIIALILLVFILFKIVLSYAGNKRKVFKNNVYSYKAKSLLMSRAESEFFEKLDQAVNDRYYVFPQIHLSTLLIPDVREDKRLYAFRHINGKSVDYVLCDKETLSPTYAIELDDYTHDKADRRKRDAEVERIFEEADIPLVRFRDKNVSKDEIIQALIDTRKFI